MNKLKSINFDKYYAKLTKFLLVIFVLFLCIYTFATGLQGDDFYYLAHPLTKESIKSVADMISATKYIYQTWNGRYLINFLNHFIVNKGMLIQTISVVLFFIASLLSIFKLSDVKIKFSSYFLLVVGFMFITSDEFLHNISCLNISLNYFFIIPIYIFFISYIEKNKQKYSPLEFVMLCIVAFLCGSFTEAYSFSLALVIIVQIVTKEFNMHWQNVVIGIFYVVGVLILLLCPGSSVRSNVITSDPLFIAYWLNGNINSFCDWGLLPFIISYVTFKWCKLNFKDLDKVDRILLIYAIVQVFAMIFSPYLPQRALLLVNISLITLSIKWIGQYKNLDFLAVWLGAAICGQLIIQIGIAVLL